MVPESGPARANPARGLALIATAVILCIFVLRQGWDEAGSVGADEASPPPAGESESGGNTTTTAPREPRPKAEIVVRVANASGVSGAAGRLTDTLVQGGYQTVEATDAPEGTDPNTTTVLYAPDWEVEASMVAEAAGASPTAIVQMANPPQVDPAGAQLVVLLGKDLAE